MIASPIKIDGRISDIVDTGTGRQRISRHATNG